MSVLYTQLHMFGECVSSEVDNTNFLLQLLLFLVVLSKNESFVAFVVVASFHFIYFQQKNNIVRIVQWF